MQATSEALTVQFLAWIAEAPRTYGDAEAWRRSCPHLTIWEDAIDAGLIRFDSSGNMRDSRIVLTAQGRAWLNRHD